MWARRPTPPAVDAPGLSATIVSSVDSRVVELRNRPLEAGFKSYTFGIDVLVPGNLYATIFSSVTAGECFVVDDVTVTRTPL
jgi:hypothetical protein